MFIILYIIIISLEILILIILQVNQGLNLNRIDRNEHYSSILLISTNYKYRVDKLGAFILGEILLLIYITFFDRCNLFLHVCARA